MGAVDGGWAGREEKEVRGRAVIRIQTKEKIKKKKEVSLNYKQKNGTTANGNSRDGRKRLKKNKLGLKAAIMNLTMLCAMQPTK